MGKGDDEQKLGEDGVLLPCGLRRGLQARAAVSKAPKHQGQIRSVFHRDPTRDVFTMILSQLMVELNQDLFIKC